MKPYSQRILLTENEWFATDNHTFAGWMKARLEFLFVDFDFLWGFRILQQKLYSNIYSCYTT